MNKPQILKCSAREILDSRGNPTVEATVYINNGTVGVASVPSGASTGIYEAHELRDEDASRYGGKGVLAAVANINGEISSALAGVCASDQSAVDDILISLDGTGSKSRLGANAMLAVSLAAARASANWYGMSIFRYLGGVNARRLPVPMLNILNGGAHASNNIEIQEFMIVPVGAPNFAEALRTGSEITHTLGKILKNSGLSSTVGDEGGFAPNLADDEEAIQLILSAIVEAGYDTSRVKIALDAASGEWYDQESGDYIMKKRGIRHTRDELIAYWAQLCGKYPIMSIEDGLDQRDFEGWTQLTKKLGDRVMLVGDDLFVTNEKRLAEGIGDGAGNAILIKPNQIGTLSETLRVIRLAEDAGYSFILSHRSGETEDTTLADIAVSVNAPFIKTGAPCRSERVAKYNRLLRIECLLGTGSVYGSLIRR